MWAARLSRFGLLFPSGVTQNAESGEGRPWSEGKPNSIPGGSRTPSERSGAGLLIVREVFDFVKRNYPERSGGGRPKGGKGVRGKGRQSRAPLGNAETRRASARRLRPTLFPHRVPAHLDSVRVVDQAVENAVGHGRIADLFVPARDGQLRRENHRSCLITVFADLPEVASLRLAQRSHGPVIDHQQIDAAELGEQQTQTAIGARHPQISKQRRRPSVQCRVPVAARFLGQGAGDETLAHAGWSENEN